MAKLRQSEPATPPERGEFGFRRTRCACRKCRIWCEHLPGFLVPSDLTRLIPAGADPFQWAEQHLRASASFKLGDIWVPSLVPAKQENGHCHWYEDGKCAVHENSPFGCAFLDQHLTGKEADKRRIAGRTARFEAFKQRDLYAQLWEHLLQQGLRYITSNEDRLRALVAIRKISEQTARNHRRKEKKRKRRLAKHGRR